MSDFKKFLLGLSFILFFIIASQLVIIYRAYIYSIGLDRDIVLLILWLIPSIVSFSITSFSKNYVFLKNIIFIVFITVLAPITHYLVDLFNLTEVDFGGLIGMKVTIPLFLIMSILTVGLGFVFGSIFKIWLRSTHM